VPYPEKDLTDKRTVMYTSANTAERTMPIIADLHIHSPYSRATSRDLSPRSLYLWAQYKGVQIVGTGDFTHPQWLAELEDSLEPAEDGLLQLKPSQAKAVDPLVPPTCRAPVRFIFQTEISTIYKRGGQTRKVHHLILLPDRRDVDALSARLERIGNLKSDGRPILGLDSRDLLEIVLEVSDQAIFIPAHIWTPWFSVFGSKSGFDAIEACYEDLTPHVAALETGLSSDPAMNWRWSALDNFRLVSNSDAHSPSRLGREANVLEIPLSFSALRQALFSGEGFVSTIEFFPEEGKYHLDGHRKCSTRLAPEETRRYRGLCPTCGRPVTVGVMHRVEELGDRPLGTAPAGAKPYCKLLSLDSVLAEILDCGPQSKRVRAFVQRVRERWGPELYILRELPLQAMEDEGRMPLLAEGIRRVRQEHLLVEAGFDGQYGRIRLFRDEERAALAGQIPFWVARTFEKSSGTPIAQPALREIGIGKGRRTLSDTTPLQGPPPGDGIRDRLNERQREAVAHPAPALMILAGPGTGKTLTLTLRILHFVECGNAKGDDILAVTFTQRAAREMCARLSALSGGSLESSKVQIQTLHAFGFQFLREHANAVGWSTDPLLADDQMKTRLLREALQEACPGIRVRNLSSLLERISMWKRSNQPDQEESLVAEVAAAYDRKMRDQGAVDYDDLLVLPLQILRNSLELRRRLQSRFPFIFVDEYQDLNPLQAQLLKLLRSTEGTLTVIGDPDQSIYGFRGARLEVFFDFTKEFPDAQVVRLEENYRSGRRILEAAIGVIENNDLPFPRTIRSGGSEGAKVHCHVFDTDRAEAVFVAQEINRLVGGTSHWDMYRGSERSGPLATNLAFGDIAVLFRLHSVGRLLEEAFSKEGIPYQHFGGHYLQENDALQVLTAGLRWLMDPLRDLDLLRILATPSVGLAPSTIEALQGLAENESTRLWQVLASNPPPLSVPGPEAKRLRVLVALLENSLQEYATASPSALVHRLLNILRVQIPETRSEWNPATAILERFLATAESWDGGLLSFTDFWSLQEEADLYDPRADRVQLMTVHAAKGLEFSAVIVAGCEEGVFPYLPEDKKSDIAEERRLFYVAVTRAKQILHLTRARSRTLRGRGIEFAPSRFLEEIPEHCLVQAHDLRPKKSAGRQLKLFK
jgi:DNA helicase-2/ATP-dependent DNA helicase PcrA